MSTRDRLEKAVLARIGFELDEDAYCPDVARDAVDAILDVLMEPSEGVLKALYEAEVVIIVEDGKNYSLQPLEAYKAAIQAIKDNR